MRPLPLVLAALVLGWFLGAGWTRSQVDGPGQPRTVTPSPEPSAAVTTNLEDVDRTPLPVPVSAERMQVAEESTPTVATPVPPSNVIDALQRAIDQGWVKAQSDERPHVLTNYVLCVYEHAGLLEQAAQLLGLEQVTDIYLLALANARAENEDGPGAVQAYRVLLERNPWHSSALSGLRSADPNAHCAFLEERVAEVGPDERLELTLGRALLQVGREEEARAIALRYLSDDANDRQGWSFFHQVDPDAAAEHAQRLAVQDPAWGPIHARTLAALGDKEGAARALIDCLDRSRNEEAIDHLAAVDPERAVGYLEAWSLDSSLDVDLSRLWADALIELDDEVGAVDVLAQVVARDPCRPDHMAARELVQLDPTRFFATVRPEVEASQDARAWQNLAEWYGRTGQVDQQREALDRAIELDPWNRRYRELREDLGD